ncbi:HdeA/HdeB family chaperone [Desulfosediminicola flagellatus]|uniref:HdeA/HdeB family chaperone n=1 Tax=Desulfosediminicola flagellatus TaxID=2569541 RepID=UPI0010AD2019|nr:HdeA/HdeB family chaperone [Desulfosediminicola flagellatus]
MLRSHLVALATSAIIIFSILGTNSFASEEVTTSDLKDFTCKDAMRLSGSDRDIALALLHGYMLGKKNQTVYVVENLAEITDNFIDYCLDHPAENALASFEKQFK